MESYHAPARRILALPRNSIGFLHFQAYTEYGGVGDMVRVDFKSVVRPGIELDQVFSRNNVVCACHVC